MVLKTIKLKKSGYFFKFLLNATYVILHTKLLRSIFGLLVEGDVFWEVAPGGETILVSQIIATLTTALTLSDLIRFFL